MKKLTSRWLAWLGVLGSIASVVALILTLGTKEEEKSGQSQAAKNVRGNVIQVQGNQNEVESN